MARIVRAIVPGLPRHLTQRGVRSVDIFDDDDRELYLRLGIEVLCPPHIRVVPRER